MRVANIIEEAKLGGPQIRIVLVAHELAGQAETLVIIPEENSLVFRNKCDQFGVPYKTLGISRITKEWRVALRYIFFSPVEILRIAFFLKFGNFDVVHVSGGSWQYKGVIAGKLAGKQVLWHLNDTSMPYIFRKLFSLFSHLTDGYIYASERSKNYYDTFIKKGKPGFVIPAPVDTERFCASKKYDGDEKKIEDLEDKIVIGTIANINPIKGLEIFIHAASILNEKFDNLVFVIVGPVFDNQRNYFTVLQNLCEQVRVKNMDFTGGRADVRPLLQRFDIYVCSSLAESSPLSVWEAMAFAKPIVSTDVGDVPVYVKDGQNGFIVDRLDYSRLADRISTLVSSSHTRNLFGIQSREIAVNELNVSICARKHMAAYRKISGEIQKLD